MEESAPIPERSLTSAGHISPNFFELFTHDSGAVREQETGDSIFPPFFMSAPEFQTADPFIPTFQDDGSGATEGITPWWTGDEADIQHSQGMANDIVWPSAFQRMLDSMAVDREPEPRQQQEFTPDQ
jgi:hypothetical protein